MTPAEMNEIMEKALKTLSNMLETCTSDLAPMIAHLMLKIYERLTGR